MLRRCFSTNGRFKLPPIVGEPFKHYAPGSSERIQLEAALKEVRSQTVDIPCVVNGKEYFTGDIQTQVIPSDHSVVIAKFHKATDEIVQKAIEVAQTSKAEWANTPFYHRAMIFRRAADLIARDYRAKMNAATMLGTGKNPWQAEIDAAVETIDFLRLNTNFAEAIYESQPPLNSSNVWNRSEYRELEGFVLAISPFNFCAIGANLCTSPAIMGNTVLWKPASTSVLSNYVTYKILLEAGLPPGVISFLPGSGKTIGNSINHRDFGGLHFTGSTATFNNLWRQIGSNLDNYKSYPRIVGETGGKNFHLIHKSANLDNAVFNTLRAAFEYQGQKCSACSRAYVPKSLWPEFKKKFLEEYDKIKVGQPDDFNAFVTAVIDSTAFRDHSGYIERAQKDSSCKIICGGKTDKSQGYFIQPTAVVCENPNYESMREEIFGPILSIFVYDDNEWDATLKLIDQTSPYGLTGAIFATDRAAIIQAESALRHAAGNFYINDKSTGAVVGEQPFGGARLSGTNDKAGSHLNLLRWVSARTIKETTVPLLTWKYPHLS